MSFQRLLFDAVALNFILLLQLAATEEGYKRLAREIHNQHRARHNVNPLNANEDLNNRAVQCAQYYAIRGNIDHSCPYKDEAGENLWAQRGGTPTNEDAAKSSTNAWYSEEPQHDYNREFQPATGHFRQLVWKNSLDFGFGVGRHDTTIVVCALYSPHGNVNGEFRDNVFPP